MQVGDSVVNFEQVVRPPGVRVIVVDETEQVVYLTQELRAETNGWDWRVPGGKVFDNIGDYLPYFLNEEADSHTQGLLTEVMKAATREAEEELGATLNDATLLGHSACGATVHWDLFFVLAHIKVHRENAPEPGEVITVNRVQWDEALNLIDRGEVREERSAVWLRRILLRLLGEAPGD
jgi:8-oxo-dGTP pyrophosphatase MutT (NUDIX family)